MAKHEFGIMMDAPQQGTRYDEYEPWKYTCISVDDAHWIFLYDEIALPEIWKSDVRKWKSSMRVYSRNVLSRPYTSRMDLSCSASMLVMLI